MVRVLNVGWPMHVDGGDEGWPMHVDGRDEGWPMHVDGRDEGWPVHVGVAPALGLRLGFRDRVTFCICAPCVLTAHAHNGYSCVSSLQLSSCCDGEDADDP